jgi:signal transduction histidine kinase
LLTSISHNLKTPLAAVLAAAGTLRELSTASSEAQKPTCSATVGFDSRGTRRPRNGIGQLLALEIDHFLRPADVMIDMRAADKARLLGDLARQAAAKLGLDAPAEPCAK